MPASQIDKTTSHFSSVVYYLPFPLNTQGLKDLVKNARKSAKQAFIVLETRVLRYDKTKFETREPGVRGQEGTGIKTRPLPHPLEHSSTTRDEYWSSLDPKSEN